MVPIWSKCTSPPKLPVLQAIDGSINTPIFVSYEMVFNLGVVVRLQTGKISSSLWQPFCLQWSGKCRPSHEISWSAESQPKNYDPLSDWLTKGVNLILCEFINAWLMLQGDEQAWNWWCRFKSQRHYTWSWHGIILLRYKEKQAQSQ